MNLYSRKFSVWLVSLLGVMVIYFIYNRLSRTPAIDVSASRQTDEVAADVCDSNVSVGRIGPVGVGAVEGGNYVKRNEQREVVEEFGFARLLHQDGNDWEIEKPYMKVYRPGFVCWIGGERAMVTVEGSAPDPTPKEGILTGNVVIRILPRRQDVNEATIYLDDVAFVGEQSVFSTSGLVELVSDDIQLAGTGMELIYNGYTGRLEFLKINKLRNLRIRRWSKETALGSKPREARTGGKSAAEGVAGRKQGEYYQCVFDNNVLIETLRERVLAGLVLISDVLVPGGASDKSAAAARLVEEGPAQPRRVFTGGQNTASTPIEKAGDVAITCDGSVVVAPMGSARWRAEATADSGAAQLPDIEQEDAASAGKTLFWGRRIEYSVSSGEGNAVGECEIRFSMNDGAVAGQEARPAKVRISAQRRASLKPGLNQVVFEGNCRATMTRDEGGIEQQHIVLADELRIDLAQGAGRDASQESVDVNRVAATGTEVRLASTKRAQGRLLAGVEVKCRRMDYDVPSQAFLAKGLGVIKVDNSNTDEPQEGLGRFSLRRKCYAFVRNFDSLTVSLASNHLVADANGGSLLVDYFPLVGGRSEEKVAVTAGRVEADILDSGGGRSEIGRLVATGAVTYEDKDVELIGSDFVYDANTPAVDVQGSDAQPCRFNGAIVDSVHGDLKTGRWKTKIKAPGAIR